MRGSDTPSFQIPDFIDSLLAARRGVPARAGDLLDACRPYLLAIANQELPEALHGKVGASDLVQETLVKGLRHFATFRGNSPDELAGWLRQILAHEIRNLLVVFATAKRDLSREQQLCSVLVDADQTPPLDRLLKLERKHLLEAKIAALPEDVRQLIEMHHYRNLTFPEIAAAVGKTEDATRKAWFRAVQQLQIELARHDSSSV
jgi:RNA polymerase sigma-70 factor (ECF subfamily)